MIRRLVWPLIAIALLVAAAATAPTTRSHASKPDRAAPPPLPELPELPHASMLVDSARSEIVLELPPTDIPAAGMVRLPVFQAAARRSTCRPAAPSVIGRAAPPSPGRSWEWAATCTTTA